MGNSEKKMKIFAGMLLMLVSVSPVKANECSAPPPVMGNELTRLAATFGDDFKLTLFEEELLAEINYARTNPKEYADLLRKHLESFTDDKMFKEGGKLIMTNEGKKAVEEAIAFLEKQAPLSAVKISKGLTKAGRDHVADLGPLGKTGHYGQSGADPIKRLSKYGAYSGEFGENISYTPQSPRGHLMALIIDDGVVSRGHRKNLFNPAFKTVGVGCGDHKIYTTMCVMDFAGKYTDNPAGGAILISEF